MPELPEVETVCNALRPHLLKRRIVQTRTYTEKLRYPLDLEGRPEILQQPIVAVRRRGRWCLVEFANCHVLVIHLGMTGACRIVPATEARQKHEHIIWSLDDEREWRFRDPRKFGSVEIQRLALPGADPDLLRDLGPEPLGPDFTAAHLHAATRGRNMPIKTLIMNNAIVVGVGNIYASEALFRAALRPTTPARRLSLERCERLVQHIRAVLADAIAAGGTTIIDFKTVDGSEGLFSRKLEVYGREGESCLRCARTPIMRLVLSGRSTYYCPGCQH